MSKIKKFLSFVFGLIAFALVIVFVSLEAGDNLGGGYEIKGGREDNVRIEKNGEIVVDSTIVDYVPVSNFIVGLRLPIQRLACDGGDGYKIKLVNNPIYFVVIKSSGEVFLFNQKESFEDKLSDVGLLGEVSLDYSRLKSVWERYSGYYRNIDYSTCEILE